MTTRLTSNLILDSGDRFILFYGNVNDEFCNDDLVFGNIDFMLWQYFREQGCQELSFSREQRKFTVLMRNPGDYACRISNLQFLESRKVKLG